MEVIVGQRYKNSKNYWFTIIKRIDNLKFEIEFDEVNGVKYKKITYKDCIKKGSIKNPYAPIILGVGYYGEPKYRDITIYQCWRNMLARCYDKNSVDYKRYKNHYVCTRWLCFEYFLEDYKNLEGYSPDIKKTIDKDIKQIHQENKVYSPETCCLVLKSTNSREVGERRYSYYFMAVKNNNINIIEKNQTKFSKKYFISQTLISKCLRGLQKYTHDKEGNIWKFRKLTPREIEIYLSQEEHGITFDNPLT